MKESNKPENYFLSLFVCSTAAAVFLFFGFYSLYTIQSHPAQSRQPSVPQVKGISTTTKITTLGKPVPPASASTDDTADASAIDPAVAQKLADLQSQIDALNDAIANPAPVKTVYKLVSQIDSCQLNKLSKQGWHIYSMGTIVNSLGGSYAGGSYDENCMPATLQLIDWVVLTKP